MTSLSRDSGDIVFQIFYYTLIQSRLINIIDLDVFHLLYYRVPRRHRRRRIRVIRVLQRHYTYTHIYIY